MRKIFHTSLLALPLCAILALCSCRHDEMVVPAEYDVVPVTPLPDSNVAGLYLVNEGNMGSNKCTLDYLDLSTGLYSRNFYAERNPDAIKELGDVGNDLGIYGSKLYVVVNCSHKVEVLDARTGIRITSIDIPNCRYIRFHKGYAYVSSYVGPVQPGSDSPKGAVCRIDTTALRVDRSVTVGYQPEEMEAVGNLLYVANSGGYRAPDFDKTVSVIDLDDFRQIRQIPVDINLHRLRKDRFGRLWVTSRGDNLSIPSRLHLLSEVKGRMQPEQSFEIPVSNLVIHGDRLYYFGLSHDSGRQYEYGVIDIVSKTKIADNFISDGTDAGIIHPYGIAVHPESGDIFLTDAKNYVSSGTLYCFSPDGILRWSVRTGDIPSQICFLNH